jgi:hypothetical protein
MSRRINRRASAATAATAALTIMVGSAALFAPRANAAAPSSVLQPGGRVTVSTLDASGQHEQAAQLPQSHTLRRSSTAAQIHTGANTPFPQNVAAGPRTLSSPVAVEQLQDFGGISVGEQVGAFGVAEQGVTPSDTQLAAGPGAIVEATNSSLLIMGHHGEGRHLVDQYAFWASLLPAGYSLSDPRIVYDAASPSPRFYMSTLMFGASTQPTYLGLAVSDTTDPSGTWRRFSYASPAHTFDDQPLLGMSDNTVVLSWNAFDSNAPAACGAASYVQMLVVDKGDLDTASVAQPATHLSPAFSGVQSLVPAISQASTSTEYVVYNKENLNCNDPNNFLTWSQVGVLPITGRPDANGTDTTTIPTLANATTLTLTTSNGSTLTVSAPPFASQPSGGHLLDDSDGRMQSVVFSGGNLYTAGSVFISPGNGNVVSGLIVERIITSNWGFNFAPVYSSSASYFDPATVVDGNGIAFYSFTSSGTQQYASSGAAAVDWNSRQFPAVLVNTGIGAGAYACGSTKCQLQTSPAVERWGDYSGIAVDPANPNDVWVASQFAASNGNSWGTSIGRLTVAQPTMTGLDVGSGRTSGFTRVTITGNEFDPASATGLFGGVASVSTRWIDPEHIVVTTPPHVAGSVPVQVRTADGASAVGGTFTYVRPPVGAGYWLVAGDGGIFPFGNATQGLGSTGNIRLNQPIVGMASSPSGRGYWLVAADGGIFPFGDATQGLGSTGNIRLNKPIVGMAATHDGGGYWLVASDGGIFPFGNAGGYGSHGGSPLNQPIVGMAPTPTGHGYWLVAADGGIFPYGDAGGYGSTGNIRLNQPIVGMAATTDGGGYWLVAADGGIFPFGDATGGLGSTGNIHLNQPMVGMAQSGDDGGYWLVAADGGIFPFGDATQGLGSTGNIRLNQPIVGMASMPM